ncbi:MAG: hypothetical protein PF693_13030 [Spirochaetia bacterium]|jgi:hypothetical protein|nr:hypothetical protein [Spirochaetia bacterium]
MEKGFLVVVIMLFGFFLSVSLFANGGQEAEENIKEENVMSDVPVVEIIYLNHGPVRKVVTDIDNLLEEYGEEIQIIQYTFSSSEGKLFVESRKLDGHIPLAIFIDGSMEFTVDNRSVEFISFPQGGGTGFVADGEWSLEDLKRVLDGILEQS